MDYFVNPWTWLAIAVFVGMIIAIFYHFRLEPMVRLPLSNEEDLGRGKISLPQLSQFNDGEITTALHYVQSLWARLIQSASSDAQASLLTLRDAMYKGHFLAQRCGRDKKIYIFNENPMDPKFHVREDKGGKPVRYIHTEDAMSLGAIEGFEWIGAKLGKEKNKFGEDERDHYSVLLESLRFLKLAATGTEQLKKIEEQRDILKGHLEKTLERLNDMTGKKGESDIIAATNPLTGIKPPEQGFGKFPSVKQFFTWLQVAVLFGCILFVPIIMNAMNIEYQDKLSVALVVGFIGYIATPFVRKALGK